MTLNQSEMERLSFIRRLHRTAIEQSRKPQPTSSQSILTFHDAVELFLYLSAEHLHVSKPSHISFLEYWDRIPDDLEDDQKLSHKPSMERLNRARRNLKHAGNRPNSADIDSYRIAVTEFFEENTPKVFGIDFADISMVDLVDFERTQQNLKEAEEALEQGQFEKAIKKSAEAFERMQRELREISREKRGYSPMFSNRGLGVSSSLRTGTNFISPRTDRDTPSEVEQNARNITELAKVADQLSGKFRDVEKSLDSLQDALQVLSLGIDYQKYARFQKITPRVSHSLDGDLQVSGEVEEEFFNQRDAQYCIQFVVETSLSLQDELM